MQVAPVASITRAYSFLTPPPSHFLSGRSRALRPQFSLLSSSRMPSPASVLHVLPGRFCSHLQALAVVPLPPPPSHNSPLLLPFNLPRASLHLPTATPYHCACRFKEKRTVWTDVVIGQTLLFAHDTK